MGYESTDLVPQLLAGNNCNFFTYSFVGMEIECQSSVVFLDDNSGCLLNSLCSYTTLRNTFGDFNIIYKTILKLKNVKKIIQNNVYYLFTIFKNNIRICFIFPFLC